MQDNQTRIHWIKSNGESLFGAIVPTITGFVGFTSINGSPLDLCFSTTKHGVLRVGKKMLERIIARYEANNLDTKILHEPKFN